MPQPCCHPAGGRCRAPLPRQCCCPGPAPPHHRDVLQGQCEGHYPAAGAAQDAAEPVQRDAAQHAAAAGHEAAAGAGEKGWAGRGWWLRCKASTMRPPSHRSAAAFVHSSLACQQRNASCYPTSACQMRIPPNPTSRLPSCVCGTVSTPAQSTGPRPASPRTPLPGHERLPLPCCRCKPR